MTVFKNTFLNQYVNLICREIPKRNRWTDRIRRKRRGWKVLRLTSLLSLVRHLASLLIDHRKYWTIWNCNRWRRIQNCHRYFRLLLWAQHLKIENTLTQASSCNGPNIKHSTKTQTTLNSNLFYSPTLSPHPNSNRLWYNLKHFPQ